MKKNKISLTVLAVVVLVGGFFYYVAGSVLAQTSERSSDEEIVFCTQDAKLCPDGSYVSRTGPNCEFAACPSEAKFISTFGAVGTPFTYQGAVSDDDSSNEQVIITYKWRQVSGPFRFEIKEGRILSVVPQTAGTYEFELLVTGKDGNSSIAQTLQLEVRGKFVDGDLDRPIITGGVVGPVGVDTDINLDGDLDQRTSDLGLVDGATPVIINRVQVRGWDPEKKREFLETVKTHAELSSRQDLENFAAGVLLRNKSIEAIEIAHEGLKMHGRMSGKIFGLFNAPLRVRTEIKSDGEVKVKFPWYSFLYKKFVTVDEIKAEIELGVADLDDWVVLSAGDAADIGGEVLDTEKEVLEKEGDMNEFAHRFPVWSASQIGELISLTQEVLLRAYDK